MGAMGFGLPATIRAVVTRPDAIVVDIDGDGSFIMNVQELATIQVGEVVRDMERVTEDESLRSRGVMERDYENKF
ncbi:Agglutinin-like protein 1 precursor [Sarracenia purpurea var. burkii]